MFISALLVGLLATLGQWWFWGPITKCLVYPLTTGVLTGLFMGDPYTGMLAGASIQLIYLGWIQAGGTMPSNAIVAGIFGTAMTILAGADYSLAVVFAVPLSMFGLLLNQLYMTINSFWVHQADKLLEQGKLNGIWFMNFIPSFFMSLLLYGVPAFLLVLYGDKWGSTLFNQIPQSLVSALQVVGAIMPALGIAMLLNYLGKKKLIPWFFAGFFMTQYLKLDIMAIAIFATIIAIVIFNNENKKEISEKKSVRRLSLNKNTDNSISTEENPVKKNYENKLTKKDLIKTWLYTMATEACYNYERLQALGIATLMLTPIKKLYKTNEQRIQEIKKYTVFYNSEVFLIGPIINGVAVSMEEARANGENISAENINSVRTGLMGPIAGIGDTISQGILYPILAGIGCTLALSGNYIGPIFFTVVYELIIFACGYKMFMYGYKYGKSSLMRILKNGIIDKVTNSFCIVGLMVVGSMASSRVMIYTPLQMQISNGSIEFQSIINALLPGLIPLLITLCIWKAVSRKVNMTLLISIIFIIGIISSYLNILGYIQP